METLNYSLSEAIPGLKKSEGWKEVPIIECGEKLVEIGAFGENRVVADSQYFKQGINHSNSTVFARETVVRKLVEASYLLPADHRLVIWDAWRPLEVQQSLFDEYRNRLRLSNPSMDPDQLSSLTQTYVSLPSKSPLKPSPHYTGGAVDLSIIGGDGVLLDMGTVFDHFGKEAATTYYEIPPAPSSDTSKIVKNRRLLYNVMISAGFSAYDEEWWHFDYGNQFDAIRTGKKYAIYGPTDINL